MNGNVELLQRTQMLSGKIESLTGNQEEFYEYFDDAEVEYRIDSALRYRGAYVFIEGGGPTTWVDTSRGTLESRWGGFKVSVGLDEKTVMLIDDYFSEIYNSQRGAQNY